jgi:hypothetical protein
MFVVVDIPDFGATRRLTIGARGIVEQIGYICRFAGREGL